MSTAFKTVTKPAADTASATRPSSELITASVTQSAHDAIDRASEKAASAEQTLRDSADRTEMRAREMSNQAQINSRKALKFSDSSHQANHEVMGGSPP